MPTQYAIFYTGKTDSGFRQAGIFGVYSSAEEANGKLKDFRKAARNQRIHTVEVIPITNDLMNSLFSFC